MRVRRTWGRLIAVLAVALVAAVGFAPRSAWAAEVSTADDLRTALAATTGDDTVTLAGDIQLESEVTVAGNKTLDLNGFDISGSIGRLVVVPAETSLTIQDDAAEPGSITGGTTRAVLVSGTLTLAGGTIDSDGGQAVLANGEGAHLSMTGGTIHGSVEALRGQWASIEVSGGTLSTDKKSSESGPLTLLASTATISGDARIEGYYGVTLFNITEAGAVDNDSTAIPSSFTMNGGSIDCAVFAISGNNTQSATCSATINDGTITADDTAIYWPMEGKLTVTGGTITGGNAIEAKMGTINISGGTLRGTEEYGFAYTGNGSASDGAAVKLVSQLYGSSEGQFINDPNLTVNITGGTLESANGNAMTVYADNKAQAYGGGDLKAAITVSDNATLSPAENFDGLRATTVGEFALSEDGATTGNTTISSPELAAAAVVANGKTQTGPTTSQNGNTLYTSVERAIASATSDDVVPDDGAAITLLRDVDENVTIPEGANVKLDLGGKTLTGSIENNGSLQLTGTGDLIGQVTGADPTVDAGVEVTVARIGEKGYPTIEAALADAQPGDTITLATDVALDSRLGITVSNVTLDLSGHKVSAAANFDTTGSQGNQLISIDGAKGVVVKGGTIEAGTSNGHALNVWNSTDVTIADLTLDHSKATTGAPLIVGASDVTVSGEVNIVTGGNSWYGINLDSRKINDVATAASLTFAEGATVDFSGVQKTGVYVENTAKVAKEDLQLTFEPNVNFTSGVNGFVPVAFAETVEPTVEGGENVNFGIGEDGAHMHIAANEVKGYKDPTCTEEGYTGDTVCSICGETIKAGEAIPATGHTLGKVQNYVAPTTTTEGYTGDQYCTVCGALVVKGDVIPVVETDSVVMFRLYNRWTGEHFYTSSEVELNACVEAGWSYEGVGWIAPKDGAEVYRMYNPYVTGGDHHYTMSAEERDSLVEAGWKYEGVAWYSADEETGVPVLREYNPFATTGTHNYTISQDEHDNLVSLGWKDEGIAWYAAQ